jgi:hypothetical protein
LDSSHVLSSVRNDYTLSPCVVIISGGGGTHTGRRQGGKSHNHRSVGGTFALGLKKIFGTNGAVVLSIGQSGNLPADTTGRT